MPVGLEGAPLLVKLGELALGYGAFDRANALALRGDPYRRRKTQASRAAGEPTVIEGQQLFARRTRTKVQRVGEVERMHMVGERGENDRARLDRHVRQTREMLDDAKNDGHAIRVISAFRSFDEQIEVKGQHTLVYGSGANAFSADQGYSEHQLGTAIDIADTVTGGTYTSFATTEAYAWLQKNAHKYGFILSYPEGNQFFIFEPWHWRFVGRDLAKDLHNDKKTFYDLDQRELDAYLVKIFD